MKACKILSFIIGLCCFFPATAQEIIPPLDIPLYLSGNFGELRSNHFHSGIDFKTQGKTGIPVKAVKAGYIYRVAVSPYGYGRAVYIDHQDGTSSVYGHLDHFAPAIEQAVTDKQYEQESFAVDLQFPPEEFPVKQGEVFAYSGNTGRSGGPHLHFELRYTDGDIPFDPLPYYKDKIKDTRPPEIRGIMLFPIDNSGVVNGSTENQAISLVKDKSGKQSVNKSITAWGEIGVGIKAYDKMSETSNIYGVNEIILKVDGDTVYHSVMNSFSFDDTRYLNSYIDWNDWIENKSFYMKSFTDPGNYLGLNRSLHNGVINVDEERSYRLEYELIDVYGNKSRLNFSITGKETAIPHPAENDVVFHYNRANAYTDKGIELSIPRRNLYTTQYPEVDTVWDSKLSHYSPLYRIGERIPLHGYCPLTLEITNDTYTDKNRYGVVYIYQNDKTWLGGEYDNGRIHTRTRELGEFVIMTDDKPPVITPVAEAKWTANRKIAFKITDNLSGVKSYKATFNGRFILFEFDAKTNSLFHVFGQRTPRGSGTLEVTVTDGAGNTTVGTYQVTLT
jgi:Membrane proteins related to metalloendopeptidases